MQDELPDERWLRFSDLVDRGIVKNRTTVARWVRSGVLPAPKRLGPNTTAWRLSDILRFEKSRPAATKSRR